MSLALLCPGLALLLAGAQLGAGSGGGGVAGSSCPAEWRAACPGLPCAPLATPVPRREVMGWRARWSTPVRFGSRGLLDPGCMDTCAKQSWTNYINDSAISTVIISTGGTSHGPFRVIQ